MQNHKLEINTYSDSNDLLLTAMAMSLYRFVSTIAVINKLIARALTLANTKLVAKSLVESTAKLIANLQCTHG